MNKKLGLIAFATALQLMHAGSQAAAVISIQEVGLDVVATGTGTLDLTGLAFGGTGSFGSFIIPAPGFVIVGDPGVNADFYSGPLTGPASFGPGGGAPASFGSGGQVGLLFSLLAVPTGYVTNGPILATATFSGESLSSIGATPGTYAYSLGNGDSLTVQIGPVAAVPEPSSVAMVLAGIAFVAGVGARRRSGRKASSQGIS